MASINRDEISRLELLHAAHPEGLVFPHLADAYRRAGRLSQAESVLSDGLRQHSDYSSAHVVLGRLRLDQGKESEAEEAFRRVLELDPDNHIAMDYLARLAADQGRLDESLRQMRRLARVKPTPEVQQRLRELEGRAADLRSRPGAFSGPGAGAYPGESDPAAGGGPGSNGGGPAVSLPGALSEGTERISGTGTGGPERAEPAQPRLPDPGEVVTETMAELYSRQGLHERAARVYRQLLERAPGDTRLRAKLSAAESMVAANSPGVSEERGRRADPNGAGASSGQASGAVPTWSLPSASRKLPGEEEGEGTGSTIRGQIGSILAWKPDRPSPAAASEPPPERRAETSASDPPSPRPAPGRPPASPSPESEDRGAAVGSGGAPGSPLGGASRSPGAKSGLKGLEGLEGLEGAAPRARSLIAITDMLVGLLEYRDPFFRGSSSLTRLVATSVGEELGLSPTRQVDLALAAVLRDLGRLAMGGRLVAKSSPETPEVRRKIERHVDLALHLLEGIELPDEVRSAVRHHHERWDGGGYPDGLSGESIPLLARILAVVDSFAAMVSPRSYRLPRKVPDAARELRESAGTQYDPAVVDALMRVLARGENPHLGFVQRPHILLVNPDQPGALVTAAKLCTSGYLAEVAPSPEVALERLRRVPVAAVLVSAEVGEEAAAAFIRQLRVNELFASLPVVVVDAGEVLFRVRLLDSGADVCFPPSTAYAEVQGTLAALVRRTIRSEKKKARAEGTTPREPREAPWLALQGDIKDFPLTWLLQVMKYDSRTAAIGIRTAAADGAIYLQKGDAVHAQVRGGPKGEAALRAMLKWPKGRFTVHPDARPKEQSIETSIMHLLLTQAVDEDHAAAGIFGTVSAEH